MAGFGLGFSHQEIRQKCNTVVRIKEGRGQVQAAGGKPAKAKFKKLGLSMMKKVNVVRKMSPEEETAGAEYALPAGTGYALPSTIIGGETHP